MINNYARKNQWPSQDPKIKDSWLKDLESIVSETIEFLKSLVEIEELNLGIIKNT